MLNRKILTLCLLVLLMPMLTILFPLQANAARPTITISPVQTITPGDSQDYCFGWTTPLDSAGTILDGTKDLVFAFETRSAEGERFDLNTGVTNDEVTFYIGDDTCTGDGAGEDVEERVTEGILGTTSGHDVAYTTTYGLFPGYVVLVISLDSDVDVAELTPVSVGIKAVTGDSVKTPTTAGNYKVIIEQNVTGTTPTVTDWLDTQLLYIGELNQVNITATLDPSISLALDASSCQLGLLTVDAIQTCGYTATVTTNIGTGYTGYIEQNHPFQTTVNGVTHAIPDPVGVVVEGTDALTGFGEYGIGIQTDDNTSWPEFSGTCASYDALTTDLPAQAITGNNSRNIFATYTAALNGIDHGVTSFCSGTRITYETPPGNYDQLVTITVVGNF
jgi:hypothetical protein